MHTIYKYLPKLITVLLFCILITPLKAQMKKSGEIGVSVGGSYYLGDINKIPFVGTKLSVGALYRHTIDTRLALTGVFTYGKLSGDDAKSNNSFQIERNKSFNNAFYELGAVGEFNFTRFLPANKNYIYTPYVFAGLGGFYYPNGEKSKFILNIPFGIGVKYNINRKIIFGAFAGMRKTFNDDIDFEYTPPTPGHTFKQYGYAGNKDWYSVFGISLSYKIKYPMNCPAFD